MAKKRPDRFVVGFDDGSIIGKSCGKTSGVLRPYIRKEAMKEYQDSKRQELDPIPYELVPVKTGKSRK